MHSNDGTEVAQWLRCCATNRKVAGSIPAGVSGFFIDIKSFRLHYGPGVDSASNRNEYQEYFLGVKAAGAYGWQSYHHPVPLSWNLGTLTSWNPLGLSRPVMGLLYHSNDRWLQFNIKRCILAGSRTYFAAISLFRSRLLSRATEMILYKTLIRPAVLCGAEAWTLTKKERDVLIFERKIFRRIYGAKY